MDVWKHRARTARIHELHLHLSSLIKDIDHDVTIDDPNDEVVNAPYPMDILPFRSLARLLFRDAAEVIDILPHVLAKRDRRGRSLVLIATRHGHVKAVHFLLALAKCVDLGVDLDLDHEVCLDLVDDLYRDDRQGRGYFKVVTKPADSMVWVMLARPSHEGELPLHEAVSRGHTSLTQLLSEAAVGLARRHPTWPHLLVHRDPRTGLRAMDIAHPYLDDHGHGGGNDDKNHGGVTDLSPEGRSENGDLSTVPIAFWPEPPGPHIARAVTLLRAYWNAERGRVSGNALAVLRLPNPLEGPRSFYPMGIHLPVLPQRRRLRVVDTSDVAGGIGSCSTTRHHPSPLRTPTANSITPTITSFPGIHGNPSSRTGPDVSTIQTFLDILAGECGEECGVRGSFVQLAISHLSAHPEHIRLTSSAGRLTWCHIASFCDAPNEADRLLRLVCGDDLTKDDNSLPSSSSSSPISSLLVSSSASLSYRRSYRLHPDVPCGEGQRALQIACYFARPRLVSTLLELGACPSLGSPTDGILPLHIAAEAFDRPGACAVARTLLVEGADGEATAVQGQTPRERVQTMLAERLAGHRNDPSGGGHRTGATARMTTLGEARALRRRAEDFLSILAQGNAFRAEIKLSTGVTAAVAQHEWAQRLVTSTTGRQRSTWLVAGPGEERAWGTGERGGRRSYDRGDADGVGSMSEMSAEDLSRRLHKQLQEMLRLDRATIAAWFASDEQEDKELFF